MLRAQAREELEAIRAQIRAEVEAGLRAPSAAATPPAPASDVPEVTHTEGDVQNQEHPL